MHRCCRELLLFSLAFSNNSSIWSKSHEVEVVCSRPYRTATRLHVCKCQGSAHYLNPQMKGEIEKRKQSLSWMIYVASLKHGRHANETADSARAVGNKDEIRKMVGRESQNAFRPFLYICLETGRQGICVPQCCTQVLKQIAAPPYCYITMVRFKNSLHELPFSWRASRIYSGHPVA